MDDTNFFINTVLRWYEKNGRNFPWRRTKDVYRLLVAEKLLQRTQAKIVAKFYPKFISKYPTYHALAHAKTKDVERLIRPLGLYKIRARELKNMAALMEKRVVGVPSPDDLKGLKGVGEYVEKAVRCFAFGELTLPLDANIKRLISRFFYGEHVAEVDNRICKRIVRNICRSEIKKFVWGLLDFEEEICTPKAPKCHKCPLASRCRYVLFSHRA
jgi:A/G-specific adenine glycosylase